MHCKIKLFYFKEYYGHFVRDVPIFRILMVLKLRKNCGLCGYFTGLKMNHTHVFPGFFQNDFSLVLPVCLASQLIPSKLWKNRQKMGVFSSLGSEARLGSLTYSQSCYRSSMQPTLEFFKQEYVFLREGIPNTHILFHMGLYKGIWCFTKGLLAVSCVKVMLPISFLFVAEL